MSAQQRSKTAEAVAAVRARHLLRDRPTVFEDPLALHLTSRPWRVICQNRLLDWLVFEQLFAPLRLVQAQVLARGRYAEEQLAKAIDRGIEQYVILGAGLDSFAFRRRDLAAKLTVYELDHPVTQRHKLARLKQLHLAPPANLRFAPIDFEEQTLRAALMNAGFRPESPAFFSWLGTIYYLAAETIFQTLSLIAALAAPQSEIVLDYRVPRDLIDATYLPIFEETERFTARRGEPMITSFDPATFPRAVGRLGFELLEHISPAEQRRRYFAGRTDGLSPSPEVYFAHFRLGNSRSESNHVG